jgi:putative flippase GtrA
MLGDNIMGKLNQIDKAAEGKGSGVNTLWQFVKFIFVSLGACIVQVVSLAILYNIPAIKELSDTAFHWWVFDYPVIEGERCGLALFISANVANILAQIVAFFINKEKTFNSSANTAITLPIYIIFTIGLVCFSAWLNPVVLQLCVNKFALGSGLALTIATAVCSALQFFLYFPVDKILFHKKKEDK